MATASFDGKQQSITSPHCSQHLWTALHPTFGQWPWCGNSSPTCCAIAVVVVLMSKHCCCCSISLLCCNIALQHVMTTIWCWLLLLAAPFSLCCESMQAPHMKVLVLIAWGTHFCEVFQVPFCEHHPDKRKNSRKNKWLLCCVCCVCCAPEKTFIVGQASQRLTPCEAPKFSGRDCHRDVTAMLSWWKHTFWETQLRSDFEKSLPSRAIWKFSFNTMVTMRWHRDQKIWVPQRESTSVRPVPWWTLVSHPFCNNFGRKVGVMSPPWHSKTELLCKVEQSAGVS